jgi:putative nucleotidyltransferase with HDIG domain
MSLDPVQAIEQAIAQDQLILPSPPDILLRARRVLEDPATDTHKIAAVIGADPALAARILKVANSASYKRDQHIDNLPQAVARLGNRLIATLVSSHAMMQIFSAGNTESRAELNRLQAHSLAVAILSYAIARHCTRLPADDALLAGLVHDIGYLPIQQFLAMTGTALPSGDRQRLFEEHGRLGARLLTLWRFPLSIIAVANEHEWLKRPNPDKADLVDVVQAANLWARREEDPTGQDPLQLATAAGFIHLGLNPQDDPYRLDALRPHLQAARELLVA